MATAQKDLDNRLAELGFEEVRSNGKHKILRHPTAGSMSVPTTVGRGRAVANSLALAKRLVRQSNSTTGRFVDWLCERHGIAADDRQRLRLNVSQEIRWFSEEEEKAGRSVNAASLATMARQHPRVHSVPMAKGSHYSIWEVSGKDFVEVVEAKVDVVRAPEPVPSQEAPQDTPAPVENGLGHVTEQLVEAVAQLRRHNDLELKLDLIVTALSDQHRQLGELLALLKER